MQTDPQMWLELHGDFLFRFAISRLHDEELATDMIQETLLAAWRNRQSFSGQSSERTWLTSILQHKIIDHIRAQIRRRNLQQDAESDPTSLYFKDNGSWQSTPESWHESPEKLYQNDQFLQVLTRCIEKLPDKQQEVFRLREVVGEESSVICNRCDISATNLHVLLHRARMALRICLERNWIGKQR